MVSHYDLIFSLNVSGDINNLTEGYILQKITSHINNE